MTSKQCLINRDRHQHKTRKGWTTIGRLSVIWKSVLTDKIKRMEKKLDGNYTRMLQVILKQVLVAAPQKAAAVRSPTTYHGKLSKLDERDMRGHCWRSKDELLINILLWTLSHGRVKAGRKTGTYIQQLCADTGCNLENLLGAMDDRDGWGERVRETLAGSATLYIYIYIYIYCKILWLFNSVSQYKTKNCGIIK